MSLRGQALSGIVWTVVDTFILKGLSFIASLILARWLGPAEFGLVGMIAVFIAIGVSLTDSGLTNSLIRAREKDDRDYTTVFWLNLGMSALVYTVLFFGAPLIASFFEQPILIGLVRLYCFSFVISAFSAVQLARLTSDMAFKKIAKLNIPGTIVGVIAGLFLGYNGYGAYAIVWMYLITQIIQSIMLWATSNWKPTFSYSKEKAKYHYGFGYKLMLSGLINTLFGNIYNIIIGKLYNPNVLGLYERSRSLNMYPVTVLTAVVSKVTYPLLSGIQDDKEKVGVVYRKILRITFFLTAPLMLIAAAMAKPLFNLVLGPEWNGAVPFFQILCLSTMFYPIQVFNLNVFMVYGRSDLFLKLEVVKKIVIVIAIWIGYWFGIYGLVWSSVITSYTALLINTHYSAEMINYSQKQQFKDMLPTFLFGFISAVLVSVFYLVTNISSDWVKLFFGFVIGGGGYLCLNYLFKSAPLFYCLSIVKEKLR
ncbi:lipopolysaccharide biosynthesis protein [Myroides odoratimimus]|uniref:lipopolysaccharide biosynthesis protein n=1 Tax=Myroides odoratimimus TaxID=76832 RepID=UPI002574F8BC|nr:lipopolysaccharide biosynthesis protein [Myroides odoratimimus]MDM1466505.1 lipopolysaccharide biosynthesis protein [Myroides odoratimimus]MDM1469655.1 lipopolysaccharide biosynthesis protein [Myroides odoratimimus]MDM1479667.1 lipopolysaccharide biosynthesis protein [Myroides odoratimimus]